MPEEGVEKKLHSDMLTEDELLTAVRAAASLGINKIRITGGEPLVKRNILSICRGIAETEGINELCLTTNGTLLPELAVPLREAGVKRVNISLDTLDPGKYAYMTRRDLFKTAIAGIEAALSAGFERVKLNTVLIGGFNDDEIENICRLTCRYDIDVRFIELMPMYDSGEFGPDAFADSSRILARVPELVAEEINGVATIYRLPGAKGRVGIISPVSHSFCQNCSRLRLTADGRLKPCLHSSAEYPIKGMDFEGMREQMIKAIMEKPSCHGELSYNRRSEAGRNMNEIGG